MSIPPPTRSDEELNSLFTEACIAQTEGRLAEAMDNYLLLLKYFPKAAMLCCNLGLVYYSLENFAALGEFSLALTCRPEDSDTLFGSPGIVPTLRRSG